MQFTRYYSRLIKANGVPNLDVEQHCRLMNIISLEGQLNALEKLKKGLSNSDGYHAYDVKIHKVNLQIKKLTLGKYPKDVVHDMVFKSVL